MNQAALTIALVSISISIVGLLWQLTLYRLSGARVRVEFSPVVMTHLGSVIKGSQGRWPTTKPDGISMPREDDLWAELAQIRVANIGRTVVWVSEIGLDFGSEVRLRRRRRLTISPIPIEVAGGIATTGPIRLEPGQSMDVNAPMAQSISWVQSRRPHGSLLVRGTATLAGRRAKRSPARYSLRLRGDDSSHFPDGQVTPQVITFQLLVNHWPTSDIRNLYEAWLDVWNALQGGTGTLTLADALKPHFSSILTRVQMEQRLRKAYRPSATSVSNNP